MKFSVFSMSVRLSFSTYSAQWFACKAAKGMTRKMCRMYESGCVIEPMESSNSTSAFVRC